MLRILFLSAGQFLGRGAAFLRMGMPRALFLSADQFVCPHLCITVLRMGMRSCAFFLTADEVLPIACFAVRMLFLATVGFSAHRHTGQNELPGNGSCHQDAKAKDDCTQPSHSLLSLFCFSDLFSYIFLHSSASL